MELTFDHAIELLEISDISKLTQDDIAKIERTSKKRWHPDKVAHLKDSSITNEYTQNFQNINLACEMIISFLKGTYHGGEAFSGSSNKIHEEPEEVIRKNAPDIQTKLRNVWVSIKQKKFKLSIKEIVLSDGFKLKNLLSEDFKEDLAMLSVVSFFYGIVVFGISTFIANAISPVLGTIVAIVWAAHALSCILGFIPLSRFWLPEQIQNIVFKFINFGLKVYYWAESESESSNVFLSILVKLPMLFALLIKYVILFPLYELAKVIVGDKIVGVVKQNVNYYAEAAEWYIDELISKNPDEMVADELFHLSYIYGEFADFKTEI